MAIVEELNSILEWGELYMFSIETDESVVLVYFNDNVSLGIAIGKIVKP